MDLACVCDLWVCFVLVLYYIWRNLWDEEEDDEERDGIILVLVIYGHVIWREMGMKGRERVDRFYLERRRRLVESFLEKVSGEEIARNSFSNNLVLEG